MNTMERLQKANREAAHYQELAAAEMRKAKEATDLSSKIFATCAAMSYSAAARVRIADADELLRELEALK